VIKMLGGKCCGV